MNTMSSKDRRKNYLADQKLPYRILVFTKILLLWYEPQIKRPERKFRCEKVNLLNPLTYVLMVLLMIVDIYQTQLTYWKEIAKECKTQRSPEY